MQKISQKHTKEKLTKSNKLGKKLFYGSLIIFVISVISSIFFTESIITVLVFPSIVVSIISLGMWRHEPNKAFCNNLSTRNSLDQITDPIYNYNAGNIYNHRR